jgi:hypothetical protein
VSNTKKSYISKVFPAFSTKITCLSLSKDSGLLWWGKACEYLLGRGIQYKHAQIQRKLAEISFDFGYELPILYTPYELLGG